MTNHSHWFHTKDRNVFIHITRRFLLRFESRYVQVCSIITENNADKSSSSFVLFDKGACIGFAFIDGTKLYISDVPLDKLPELAHQIITMNSTYTYVAASKTVAKEFLALTKQDYRLEMNHFILACSELKLPPRAGGRLVLATKQNFDVVKPMFE